MESPGATTSPLEYVSDPALITPPAPRRWKAVMVYAVIGLIAVAGIWYGWNLRHWAWEESRPFHFAGDVENGWMWGRNADSVGLFYLYDHVRAGRNFSYHASLDYTPLRLSAVTAWFRWTEVHFPGARSWQDSYAFTWPMLWGNNIASLACAVLTFLLIRHWQRRATDPPRRFLPEFAGLVGAMLVWFNPAVLHDGHAWPQWDIWCLPFYLAAVLLGCHNRWFVAGISLAIGASLKGQLLMAAPILVLWPLVGGQFSAVIRLICGAVVATTVIALPFMRPGDAALIWLMLSVAAVGMLTPIVLRWNYARYKHLVIPWVVAAMLLAYPWMGVGGWWWMLLPAGVIGAILLCRFVPPQLVPHIYALAIAILILLMMPLFNASNGWWKQGFVQGSGQHTRMAGNGVWNIPKLLVAHYRWPNDYRTNVKLPTTLPVVGQNISARTLMLTIYGACLVLCAIGANLHLRRNDPRFLVAMVAPWVLFYVLLTQMHGRYLVWGAAVSALLAGVSVGAALLGIIISLLAWFGMMHNQYLISDMFASNQWFRWINGYIRPMDPGVAWMVILAAAVLLYLAVVPRKSHALPKPDTQ